MSKKIKASTPLGLKSPITIMIIAVVVGITFASFNRNTKNQYNEKNLKNDNDTKNTEKLENSITDLSTRLTNLENQFNEMKPKEKDKKKNNHTGLIAGFSVGGIVLVVLAILTVFNIGGTRTKIENLIDSIFRFMKTKKDNNGENVQDDVELVDRSNITI